MSDVRPGQRVTPEAARDPRGRRREDAPRPAKARPGRPAPPPGNGRPLYVTGLVASLWCVGIGLTVLTTVTLLGWVAAPKTALGHGLSGVFRTAVNFWLVSHHAGFSYGHGRVGLLPLGVLVLPGALLYRGGAWMIRGLGLPARPRVAVMRVAAALAVPYALLAMLMALAVSAPEVHPSAWQALLGCLLVAVIAGGLGAARAVVAAQVAAEARGRRVRSGLGALLRLLPDRPRSLVIGVAGSVAVLAAAGAVLVGGSLALHTSDSDRVYDLLAPGIVGGVLLLLVELAFLPNAVIWGIAYAVGPGFAVGAGTSVSPTGVFLDTVPAFPPLAALPEAGPAPAVSLLALAAPFVAGAAGGVLTIRTMPSATSEGAPLWGFLSGTLTGVVVALLAALSGGPLGDGRMATVGPSAWQVGLLAALEVGISAALAAWAANWRIMRRPEGDDAPGSARKSRARKSKARKSGERRARRPEPRRTTARLPEAPVPLSAPVLDEPPPAAGEPPAPRPSPYAPDPLEFEEAEPVLAPRRRRGRGRAADPLPDLIADEPAPPAPEPEPAPREPEPDERDGKVVLEGHIVEDAEPEPEPVPPPREDPERTENRGGAIYVLREEPRRD
ncbi:cell division protein PerM [Actinomadura physcomitrii]|uniref:cell division protein PerM n=1 Tax=Actinomadura physcomitrii TaxID=2650748 RepID=UPI002E25B73F